MHHSDIHPKSITDKFSTREKVLWRLLYADMLIAGVFAISLSTLFGALLYIGLAVMGLGMLVIWCLCANCRYPYHFDTCLFFPARWIRGLFKYRGGAMTGLDKLGFSAAFALTVLIPQYWLIRHPWLLGFFWAGGLPLLIAFPLHYCRRCRHGSCPFNRLPSQGL